MSKRQEVFAALGLYRCKDMVKLMMDNTFSLKSKVIRERIHQETGIPIYRLLLSLLYCTVRFHVEMEEYLFFSLYRLNTFGRKSYLYYREMEKLRDRLNKHEYRHIFQKKGIFNQTFAAFIKREWLYTPGKTDEEILAFIQKEETVFIKPAGNMKGRGAFKLSFTTIEDPVAFCESARENQYLIEEVILQHPAIAAVNPHSVNTVRINSVVDQMGNTVILNAIFRCAADVNIVDNFSQGGIITTVDLNTGLLQSNSILGEYAERCLKHPLTGLVLPGIQIPYWEEALQLVREASQVVPQIRLVGWDVAFTEQGPLLIEGNHLSGIRTMQYGGTGLRRFLYAVAELGSIDK